MTCRQFSADEAKALGFLNRVTSAAEVLSEARSLAETVASKPRNAISATKLGVNAVTSQQVGTARAWADADGLVSAFFDEESGEARRRYLAEKGK